MFYDTITLWWICFITIFSLNKDSLMIFSKICKLSGMLMLAVCFGTGALSAMEQQATKPQVVKNKPLVIIPMKNIAVECEKPNSRMANPGCTLCACCAGAGALSCCTFYGLREAFDALPELALGGELDTCTSFLLCPFDSYAKCCGAECAFLAIPLTGCVAGCCLCNAKFLIDEVKNLGVVAKDLSLVIEKKITEESSNIETSDNI